MSLQSSAAVAPAADVELEDELLGAVSRDGAHDMLGATWRTAATLELVTHRRELDEPFDFVRCVEEALDTLPLELRAYMSNVAILVEDEPPPGRALLGLYEGHPLTHRGSGYGAVLPDRITIYRGPLERHFGGDPDRLAQETRRVVLHEIAHHFGISDERLRELGAY